MNAPEQIVTLTFFQFESLYNQVWAFFMMRHGSRLFDTSGSFTKVMGVGKGNGFNPYSDFSLYCVLKTWNSKEQALTYLTRLPGYLKYEKKAGQLGTMFLKPIMAKGKWDGLEPFDSTKTQKLDNSPVVVLTRATIKRSLLRTFWKNVPDTAKTMTGSKGLYFAKGVGELPFVRMATVSVWKNVQSMMDFAYHSEEHKAVIAKTRELDWYSEELFARFQPESVTGNLDLFKAVS